MKLPFKPLTVPPLAAVTREEWSLRKQRREMPVRGYFTGWQIMTDNWLLRQQDRIWMSLSPAELEGQAHHLYAARGRVLVGGLGLGALLYNLLLKPEVTEVVVVEKQREVIAIMQEVWKRRSRAWAMRHRKMHLVEGNIFDYEDRRPFDYGLIDIWPSVGDMAMRPDMYRLANDGKVRAKEWAAWTLELDYISWGQENTYEVDELKRFDMWSHCAEEIGVPLIGRSWPWMGQLALLAAENAVLS
mgnify:CR=1 FL=1